jgi:hypothetical protein
LYPYKTTSVFFDLLNTLGKLGTRQYPLPVDGGQLDGLLADALTAAAIAPGVSGTKYYHLVNILAKKNRENMQ